MNITSGHAFEGHRDHLARFGVVAEAGRIRHADELVLDDRVGDLQRLGHDGAQRIHVGAIGDDQEFAVDESTPRFLPGGDMAQMMVQPSNDPAGPSVFTAAEQQLGLKLEPAKGPAEFLVIDRVERPSAN